MRAALAALILCAPLAAEAKPSRYAPAAAEFNGDRWLRVAQGGTTAKDVTRELATKKLNRRATAAHRKRRPVPVPRPRPHQAPGVVAPMGMFQGMRREADRAVAVIGGRPSGCPHRFCGCALSLHIFGKIITAPNLNKAATWAHVFPRAAPASGMVAARSGHVFKLIAHVGGNTWKVWDANSGRGRIRIHNRSIAGYSIVNPHGGRRAS